MYSTQLRAPKPSVKGKTRYTTIALAVHGNLNQRVSVASI